MSGGSLDYLFVAVDGSGLAGHRRHIEEAESILRQRGFIAEADDTKAILDKMDEADQIARNLAGVWQALEWNISADWGNDRLMDACVDYRAKKREKSP